MDINSKKDLGRLGEEIAREYLIEKGFAILKKNYRSGWGEIDLIGSDDGWLIFAEVKTRTGPAYGSPEESIDFNKVDKIRKAAIEFLKDNKPESPRSIRFDVLSIIINKDRLIRTIYRNKAAGSLAKEYKIFSRIEHIADAF